MGGLTSKPVDLSNYYTRSQVDENFKYFLKIDEAGNIYLSKIYNRALSATEIQQNYNATKTRFGL